MMSRSDDELLISRHWSAHASPLIAGKVATTLDGRVATRSGDSQWITGPAARADVMRWRRLFPAIAVGAGTVIVDDPRLTARVAEEAEWCPIRFIFDGRLRTVADDAMPKVYTDVFRARTIVVTTAYDEESLEKLRKLEVRVWTFPSDTGRVRIADFRARCAREEISGIYVEGGPDLLSQFLAARELDYLFVYRAPVFLADDRAMPAFRGLRPDKLADAPRLTNVRHERFDDDMLTRGHVAYPKCLIRDSSLRSGIGRLQEII